MTKWFEKFGKSPAWKRLEKIRNSKNFSKWRFQNINHTPQLSEGYSPRKILYDFLCRKVERKVPSVTLPTVKTDLMRLKRDEDILVRFGHSSYFMQITGKTFLVDPVLSGNASPIPRTMKAFQWADIYTVADLPAIDYLIITHDHYDHVDYDTIIALRHKVWKVICGLGVASHFEYRGYDPEMIIETDRYETVILDDELIIHTAPARHFSGRWIIRNNTLWQSYILQTTDMKIYIGWDSGYDTHFADIGKQFWPIDLAILENGQYNEGRKYIHMLPSEVLQAAKDLWTKRLLPVHSCKFPLAAHAWDEPLKTITQLNSWEIPLMTPMIGEKVNLKDEDQKFEQWRIGLE